MENEMKKLSPASREGAVCRNLSTVTAEIKDLFARARTVALAFIVEIGRRLQEAKAMMPHGAFGGWLKENFDLSASTAGNYMRLFEEYGSEQLTLFGAISNSQSIGNLPYTKALQLLAVPAEEREDFAREVDAENLSVSELKEAIRAREAAENETREILRAKNESEARQKELEQAVAHAEIARVAAEQRAARAAESEEAVKALEEALAREKERVKKAKDALAKAKQNPEIPVETLLRLKTEAEEKARAETEAEIAAKLKEARAEAEAAKAERDAALTAAKTAEQAELAARNRVTDLQKEIRMANPLVAEFRAGFETLQDTATHLRSLIARLRETDADTADKLCAALAAFAEKYGGSMNENL